MNTRTRTVIVPAGIGKISREDLFGSFLLIREATAPFQLSIDGKPTIDLIGGVYFPTPTPFRSLSFINRTANELRVNIFVGPQAVGYAYTLSPPTVMRPVETTIAVNNHVEFPGQAGSAPTYSDFGIPVGARRSHAVICNANNSNQIKVQRQNNTSSAWVTCGFIQPNDWLPVQGDDNFRVQNPSGNTAAVSIGVQEHFFLL